MRQNTAASEKATTGEAIRWLAILAGIALALWLATWAFLIVYVPYYRTHCSGEMCGMALYGPALLLLGLAIPFDFATSISAIIQALIQRDARTALSLALLFLTGLFALYALLQDGHDLLGGAAVVQAIFGFSFANLGVQHPFAFAALWAIFPLVPATILAYSLTRDRAQRLAPLAGIILALAILVAIRLFG